MKVAKNFVNTGAMYRPEVYAMVVWTFIAIIFVIGVGRAGMVFQSYEHLWKLIHRINIEWLELRERGFKKQVIYDFEMSMQHLRLAGKEWSEEEKWNAINGILDGGKKFIPLIQCQPICYKVVDCESTETYAVENWKNRYSESYQMQEKDGK